MGESSPPIRGDMNRALLLAKATLGEKTYIPVYDPVLRALRNGEASIDLNKYYNPKEGEQQMPLGHVVLASPLRQFFIKKVKAPLMKVLIMVADRIPEITKKNTTNVNTHILIDIFEDFFKHERNTDRDKMFRAAFKIFLLEIEHDRYYRDRFNWFIEEIIKSILRHEWQPAIEGNPHSRNWQGAPLNRGGKYSIISILKDKKALENLLGDKWRLEEK